MYQKPPSIPDLGLASDSLGSLLCLAVLLCRGVSGLLVLRILRGWKQGGVASGARKTARLEEDRSECAAIQGREALHWALRTWWDEQRFQLEIMNILEMRTRALTDSLDQNMSLGCISLSLVVQRLEGTGAQESLWEEKVVTGKVV